MVKSIASLEQGNFTQRSNEDWARLLQDEVQRCKNRTAKQLAEALTQTFEKEASAGDLDLLILKDSLKEHLPSFLMSCLDTSAQGWIPFADWKKDPLVQVLAAVRVVEEKVKEKNHWVEWNDCLHSLLDSVINPDDDPSGNKVEAFNVDLEGDGTSSFPQASVSSNKIHWEAQRTAAFASWALLGLYVGSSDATSVLSSPDPALSDLGSCFQDSGISTLRVQKKKMIMQVSSEGDLNCLKLCFVGRLWPLPQGQPATFLSRRLKLECLGLQHCIVSFERYWSWILKKLYDFRGVRVEQSKMKPLKFSSLIFNGFSSREMGRQKTWSCQACGFWLHDYYLLAVIKKIYRYIIYILYIWHLFAVQPYHV